MTIEEVERLKRERDYWEHKFEWSFFANYVSEYVDAKLAHIRAQEQLEEEEQQAIYNSQVVRVRIR